MSILDVIKTNIISGGALSKSADLIAGFEGFISRPKWDYKQWSWGFGTRVPDSSFSKSVPPAQSSISRPTAKAELMKYAKPLADLIESYKFANLNDSQKAAFISFGYNCGEGSLRLLLNRLRNGQTLDMVASSLRKYITAGGVVLNDLVKRRQKESDIILKKISL